MTVQKSGEGARRTEDAIKLIRQVLSRGRAKEKKRGFLWQDIASAISEIVMSRTPQTEDILTSVLEFKGKIPLAPESHQTSVMPPEDTLRSIAIRQLSEWTGRKHLASFKAVQASTNSPTLRSIAQVAIDRSNRRAKRPSRRKRLPR